MSENPFGDSLDSGSQQVAGDKDVLGGFRIHDSGAYELTIKTVYAGKSDSGANSVTVVAEMADGTGYSWTEWVTAGTAKGGKSFTVNDKGEASYLPGFNRINAIAMLTLEKEFKALVWSKGIIKLRNKDTQTDVPTEVFMCRELEGKKIVIGLQKQIKNKEQKNQTTGKWEKINDKVERNEVDKIFQAGTRRTLQEALAKQAEGEFIVKWLKANEQPRDMYKHIDGAPAANTGAPGAAGGNDKPTSSLFG